MVTMGTEAAICGRKLELPDKNINMKLGEEKALYYLDSMRNNEPSSRKRLSESSDNEVINKFGRVEYSDTETDSGLFIETSNLKSETNTSDTVQVENEEDRNSRQGTDNAAENIRVNNGDQVDNKNSNVNQNLIDNGNENKIRTTSFSVSDILDPNKFVGGCGIQKVWHPWLRDDGVRDYTKSNLDRGSEETAGHGRYLDNCKS